MTDYTPHKRLQLVQYSLLAFPLMFVGVPLYIYAPEFYAAEFDVQLAAIGFALLGLRAIDAIQDLLIGYLSDRFYRARPIIIALGMAALISGFWIVFHPSAQSPLLTLGIGMLLSATGFSIVSINFQALGALWRADIHQRTRITSWREAIGLIGLLAASVTPTLLGYNEDAPRAFHILTLIFLPLLAISAFVFFIWLRAAELDQPDNDKHGRSFKRLYTRWTIKFFSIYTFNTFASAIPAVLVIFFITDRLQADSLIGVFLLLYFISGAAGMPLWQFAAKRLTKEHAWMLSMILASAIFIWAFTLSAGDVVIYGFICIISGLALGADLALPPSILADRIALRQDQDITSYYFSVSTFLSKTGLAFATGITLPILGYLGYQPDDVADYNVTIYLSYGYAFIPSILKACAAFWLWRFIKQIKQGDQHHEIRSRNYGYSHLS